MFGLTAAGLYSKNGISKDILLPCNSWIYDDIINASQYLIKKENPACRDLQSTQLAVKFQMEIHKGGLVQVLNINKSHLP